MLRNVVVLAALVGAVAAMCPLCQITTQSQAYNNADFVGHVHVNSVKSANGENTYQCQVVQGFKPGGGQRPIQLVQSTDPTCGGIALFTNQDYLIAAKRNNKGALEVTSCSGIPLADNGIPTGPLLWNAIQLNPQFLENLQQGFPQSSSGLQPPNGGAGPGVQTGRPVGASGQQFGQQGSQPNAQASQQQFGQQGGQDSQSSQSSQSSQPGQIGQQSGQQGGQDSQSQQGFQQGGQQSGQQGGQQGGQQSSQQGGQQGGQQSGQQSTVQSPELAQPVSVTSETDGQGSSITSSGPLGSSQAKTQFIGTNGQNGVHSTVKTKGPNGSPGAVSTFNSNGNGVSSSFHSNGQGGSSSTHNNGHGVSTSLNTNGNGNGAHSTLTTNGNGVHSSINTH